MMVVDNLKVMDHKQVRAALDRKFSRVRAVGPDLTQRPDAGWVRAVRDALGMTSSDLGRRMGISAAAVSKIESSEKRGTIGLDTLQRAADAMECDIAYVLLPRQSLEQTVHRQAEVITQREFGAIVNSMRLEDQDPGPEANRQLYAEFLERIQNQRGLWHE